MKTGAAMVAEAVLVGGLKMFGPKFAQGALTLAFNKLRSSADEQKLQEIAKTAVQELDREVLREFASDAIKPCLAQLTQILGDTRRVRFLFLISLQDNTHLRECLSLLVGDSVEDPIARNLLEISLATLSEIIRRDFLVAAQSPQSPLYNYVSLNLLLENNTLLKRLAEHSLNGNDQPLEFALSVAKNLIDKADPETALDILSLLPPPSASTNRNLRAEYYRHRGRAKNRINDLDGAAQDFFEAHNLYDEEPEKSMCLVWGHHFAGNDMEAGKTSHALIKTHSNVARVLEQHVFVSDYSDLRQRLDELWPLISTHTASLKALAIYALRHKELETAEKAAQLVVERKEVSDTLDLLAQVKLARFDGVLRDTDFTEEQRCTLRQICSLFDRSIRLAIEEHINSRAYAGAYRSRGVTKVLLGDLVAAESDFATSFELDPKRVDALRDHCELVAKRMSPKLCFEKIVPLYERHSDCGLWFIIAECAVKSKITEYITKAYELGLSHLSQISEPNYNVFLPACMFQLGNQLERCEHITIIAGHASAFAEPISSLLSAQAEYFSDRFPACTRILLAIEIPDEIKTERVEVWRHIAHLCRDVGATERSVEIYERLHDCSRFDGDARNYLRGLIRIGNMHRIVKLCEAFENNGVSDIELYDVHLSVLTKLHEFQAALKLTDLLRTRTTEPEKLKYLLLQERTLKTMIDFGANNHKISPSELPDPENSTPQIAEQSAKILASQGSYPEAREYAIRLYYSKPHSIEATRAVLQAFFADPAKSEDEVYPPTVSVNCAVTVTENLGNASHDILIGDDTYCRIDSKAIPVVSSMADSLLGKKVGDTFCFSQNQFQRHEATITRIVRLETYIFWQVLERLDMKFPNQTIAQRVIISTDNDKDPRDSIAPILDSIDRRQEHKEKCVQIYKNNPLPISGLAEMLGISCFELTVNWHETNTAMHVSSSTPSELDAALSVLKTRSAIIIDESILGTLYSVDLENLIPVIATHFNLLMSEGTWIELCSSFRATSFSGRGKSLGKHQGRYYFSEIPQDVRANETAKFRRMMIDVKEHIKLIGGSAILEFEELTDEQLVEFLGQHSVETLAIAISQELVFWTEDARLAAFPLGDKVASRVWTQAMLHYLVEVGELTALAHTQAVLKLAAIGHTGILLNQTAIVSALNDCNFDPSNVTSKYVFCFLFNENIDNAEVFQRALRLTVVASQNCKLQETAFVFISALLEHLWTLGRTRVLHALPEALYRTFGLNVLAGVEYSRFVEEWLKSKAVITV